MDEWPSPVDGHAQRIPIIGGKPCSARLDARPRTRNVLHHPPSTKRRARGQNYRHPINCCHPTSTERPARETDDDHTRSVRVERVARVRAGCPQDPFRSDEPLVDRETAASPWQGARQMISPKRPGAGAAEFHVKRRPDDPKGSAAHASYIACAVRPQSTDATRPTETAQPAPPSSVSSMDGCVVEVSPGAVRTPVINSVSRETPATDPVPCEQSTGLRDNAFEASQSLRASSGPRPRGPLGLEPRLRQSVCHVSSRASTETCPPLRRRRELVELALPSLARASTKWVCLRLRCRPLRRDSRHHRRRGITVLAGPPAASQRLRPVRCMDYYTPDGSRSLRPLRRPTCPSRTG